jgi:putative ABC transport system permease protein
MSADRSKPRALWLADRSREVRQSLRARWTRTVLSVLAAALSAAAFLCLTGASRISQETVSKRLDRLRPSSFIITRTDDAPLLSKSLADQLEHLGGLAGYQGAVYTAQVNVPVGVPPSAHPTTYPPDEGSSVAVFAVSANPAEDLGSSPFAGRELDAGHVRRADRVVEVSQDAADQMALPDMRGRPSVYIGRRPYEVVGVARPPAPVPDLASAVMIPYTTAREEFGPAAFDNERIYVRGHVDALARLERLAPYVIDPAKPSAIQVTALGDPISLRSDVAEQLSRLVGVVTLAALLFGCIVVAITSYASVTERRQEFGIRRAVGARGGDIATFVIGETTAVGLVGGLVGLIVSVAGLLTTCLVNGAAFPLGALELAAAPCVGAAVGAMSGLLPAFAAIKIDPYVALTS